MKTYRKLSLKSLLLYAIGFVWGVLVGWWVKPYHDKETGKTIHDEAVMDKKRVEPCQEQAHTLADTQPIKVRYTAEEIMPKRYPDDMVGKSGTYWAFTNGGVWEKVGLNPLYIYEGFTWFIDIPGAPEELKPLKYPENRPSKHGAYICHTTIDGRYDIWKILNYDGAWFIKFSDCIVSADHDVDWFINYRLSSQKGEK